MSAIIENSQRTAVTGQPASAFLRDAFLDALDAYGDWPDGKLEPTIDLDGHRVPISRVCESLANCSDILPWQACDALESFSDIGVDFSRGSTYSRGARRLKRLIALAR